MRLCEVTDNLFEHSFGEMQDYLTDLRNQQTARVEFYDKTLKVWLRFVKDDLPCMIELRIKNSNTEDAYTRFAKKIKSIYYSQHRGKKEVDLVAAIKFIERQGRVGNNAIKILTNSDEWDILKIKHGEDVVVPNYHKMPPHWFVGKFYVRQDIPNFADQTDVRKFDTIEVVENGGAYVIEIYRRRTLIDKIDPMPLELWPSIAKPLLAKDALVRG